MSNLHKSIVSIQIMSNSHKNANISFRPIRSCEAEVDPRKIGPSVCRVCHSESYLSNKKSEEKLVMNDWLKKTHNKFSMFSNK